MKLRKSIILIILLFVALGKLGMDEINKNKVSGNVNNKVIENSESREVFSQNNNLILVNKENELSKEYKPLNKKKVNVRFRENATDEERYLEDIAATSIEEMFKEAEKDGIILMATSGYRSYETQRSLYKYNVKTMGKEEADRYVAKAGKSEHQTGLAIDITNVENFMVEGCVEAVWLAENAHRFGFILRYPQGKEHITAIAYEPWHIRYVGNDIAEEIVGDGLTLEEYLDSSI